MLDLGFPSLKALEPIVLQFLSWKGKMIKMMESVLE